jgi:hypothetical protein
MFAIDTVIDILRNNLGPFQVIFWNDHVTFWFWDPQSDVLQLGIGTVWFATSRHLLKLARDSLLKQQQKLLRLKIISNLVIVVLVFGRMLFIDYDGRLCYTV